MDPAVSICIPAYNHARFLGTALESALAQTYADFEIVVSDNRSTDHTREIVGGFARRDDRVRYCVAPRHVEMHSNFNRCLELARGRCIKFLCADDLLEPRCVEHLLGELEADPDTRLVASARRVFSNDSDGGRVVRYAKRKVRCSGEQAIRRCYFYGNLIGEPTAVMFRRADARGGFSARFSQLVDLEMWFRILEGGRFCFVPDVLCAVREHEGQTTRQSLVSGGVSRDKELLHAEFSHKPYLFGTLPERLLWDFRMAWSAQRERAAGHAEQSERGYYYPGLRRPMHTVAAVAWRVAGGG
jgi:glycosyltransferase involved in cell wall biosynthesis